MTPVIFRKFPESDGGEVLALFPTDPAEAYGYTVSCYAHVGQHGGADYLSCVARSRPAQPEEYAALLAELRDYGSADDKPYADIKVYRRATAQHREAFRRAQRAFR